MSRQTGDFAFAEVASLGPSLADGRVRRLTGDGELYEDSASGWRKIRLDTLELDGDLTNWRTALSSRTTSPARVAVIGSSTTEGLYAATPELRYVTRLGQALQQAYMGRLGGVWLSGGDAGWDSTGAQDTSGGNLNSRRLLNGQYMRRVFQASSFTLHFPLGPGIGPFTVSIDGAAPVTVTPDTTGSLRHTGVWQSGLLTPGPHLILVTAVADTYIAGAYAHNGDDSSGVQTFNLGRGNTTSGSYTGNPATFQRLGQIQPGLIVLMLGANDYQNGVTPTAYRINMLSIISQARAVLSYPAAFLLIGPYRRLDVTSPAFPYAQYQQVLADIAAADNAVAYLDLSATPPYPSVNTLAGDPLDLIDTDGVHQTSRGHQLMADLIAANLGISASPSTTTPVTALRPDQVGGLVSWWQADTLTGADGSAVASWAPNSGGLYSLPLTQATGSAQPVLKKARLNGHATVLFTAANSQQLATAAWAAALSTPITVLTVYRATSTAGNLFSGSTAGNYVYAGYSGNLMVAGAGNINEVTVSPNPAAGLTHVQAHTFNGTSSLVELDQNPFQTATTGVTGTVPAANLAGLRLGANSGGTTSFFDGEIAEVVVFNRALSAAELAGVQAWMLDRYGVKPLDAPLPASGSDAATLAGTAAASFARRDADNTFTGTNAMRALDLLTPGSFTQTVLNRASFAADSSQFGNSVIAIALPPNFLTVSNTSFFLEVGGKDSLTGYFRVLIVGRVINDGGTVNSWAVSSVITLVGTPPFNTVKFGMSVANPKTPIIALGDGTTFLSYPTYVIEKLSYTGPTANIPYGANTGMSLSVVAQAAIPATYTVQTSSGVNTLASLLNNLPVTSVSASYVAQITDNVILASAAAGPISIPLPSAIGNTGKEFVVKKTDTSTNAVTITTTGGQTIDGGPLARISSPYTALTLVSDGNNWMVI